MGHRLLPPGVGAGGPGERHPDPGRVPARCHGRGVARTVSRPQRARIWKVFEHYRHALGKRNQQEWLEVIQTARRHLEEKKPKLPYRAVVVDESQDFHNEEWKLIRALVPAGANDLFLVGDAHQRHLWPEGGPGPVRDCDPGAVQHACASTTAPPSKSGPGPWRCSKAWRWTTSTARRTKRRAICPCCPARSPNAIALRQRRRSRSSWGRRLKELVEAPTR